MFTKATVTVWPAELTRAEAITDLFHLLHSAFPRDVREEMLEPILEREAKLTMFLNEGFAIPHASVTGLRQVHWALGIPKQGIRDAGEARIEVVVLALYTEKLSGQYLLGLARIAPFLRDNVKVSALRAANSPDELLEHLQL